jgi:hypothetical protein
MAKRSTVGSGGHAKSRRRLSAAELYRLRRKAIAPLVSFKLPKPGNETKHVRNKVNKYFKYLISDGRQPGIAVGVKAKVRRKNDKTLRELQRSLGQGRLAGIKYAFVPSVVNTETGLVEQATLKSRCGDLPVVTVGRIQTVTVPFDIDALIRNPFEEVEITMALLMRCAKSYKVLRFRVATGEFGQTRMYRALLKHEVVGAVMEIMSEYTTDEHLWKKWVYGLSIEFSNDQRDMVEREQAFNMRKEAMKEIRRIRTDFAGVLEVMAEGGRMDSAQISRAFAGLTNDKGALALIAEMDKKGLIVASGGNWLLSKGGREYLTKWRDIQEKINGL